MKKNLKKLITIICALVMVIIISGCSVYLGSDSSDSSDYLGQSNTVEVTLNKQLIFCDTGSSLGEGTETVTFNTLENPQLLSSVEAASLVMRSVVKIQMTNGTSISSASGVIVDIEGGLNANEYYIITCHHVVANQGQISIFVPDDNCRNEGDYDYDESYKFTGVISSANKAMNNGNVILVGGDRDSDIAVLKLRVGSRKNKNNQAVSIVKSTVPQSTDTISFAEEVFAICNPTGNLPMTYLGGNISYLGREISLDSIGYMRNIVQHDCLITHGSSGGGLFNMKGQLIGITNAGRDEYKGMNYAITFYGEEGFINIATKLIKSSTAYNYGYVEGRWSLGLSITTSDTTVRGSNVVIAAIEYGSNVYGLLSVGQYITKVSFAGKTYNIYSENDFKEAIFVAREELTLGDKISITAYQATL